MVIDIIVLAVLVVGLLLGIKFGVARSLLGFVGYVFALVGAAFGGTLLAAYLYDNFFREMLVNQITEILTETAALTALEKAQAVLDGLPGVLSGALESGGVTAESISSMVAGSAGTVAPLLAEVAGPFVIGITKSVLVLVLFIVLTLVVSVVVNFISAVFKLPLLHQVDSALGGIFGLLSGAVLAVLCCMLLQTMIPLYEDGFLGVQQEDLENSFTYQVVNEYNPVKSLFSEES